MNLLDVYATMPFGHQYLHGLHFMLCSFAVLIALIPALTPKGSLEHKLAGKIYLPLSASALLLATELAWLEHSFVLFSFNAFCAYLLLSGWRAVHEQTVPNLMDWLIPSGLTLTALIVSYEALRDSSGMSEFCLLFFAANGFYLSYRDLIHLIERRAISKRSLFLKGFHIGQPFQVEWLNRHVAGMVGSVLANLSVVVLTLLPFSLHFLWPTVLVLAGGYIGLKEREKKARVRHVMATIVEPNFNRTSITKPSIDRPFRRAA